MMIEDEDTQVAILQRGIQMMDQQEYSIPAGDLQEDGVRMMGQLEDNIQVEDLQEDGIQMTGHQNISDHGKKEVLCIAHRAHGIQYHLDASFPSLDAVDHNHQGVVLFCRLPFLTAFYKHMMEEGLQQPAEEAMGHVEAVMPLEMCTPPSHIEQEAPYKDGPHAIQGAFLLLDLAGFFSAGLKLYGLLL